MLKSTGKKLNKRGGLPDAIFGGAYMLTIAITIIICIFIWVAFQSEMTNSISGRPGESVITSVMSTLTSAYYSMDYLFPFLIGGLLLISTIFAYRTGSNILLGAISFLFWIIAMVLSVVFVNVYLTVTDQFPTIYAAFPVMDIIMSNLHYFTLGWIAIITLVMFRKNNKEDIQSSFYGQ